MTEPVVIERPTDGTPEIPLLFDSPHSGNLFPDDMRPAIDVHALRKNEDAFIDQLFGHVVVLGATLVKATFPRTYCDPNRSDEDVDPAVLEGEWDRPFSPSEKLITRGAGVVPVKVHGLTEIYDRRLTVDEVKHRLDTYWRPYHRAIEAEMDRLHSAFGVVYHINCHSTREVGNRTDKDGEVPRADFILGNRDGTTCSPEFMEAMREFLHGRGFRVDLNWPMKGMELVRRYSDPTKGRHSLQIELNRKLYMDEAAIEKNEKYADTARLMADMNKVMADFVRTNLSA